MRPMLFSASRLLMHLVLTGTALCVVPPSRVALCDRVGVPEGNLIDQ